MLRVSELTAGYGSMEILHGVSIELMRGELVALLGPNGHGKTTLLRAISGLIPRTGGEVLLETVDLSGALPEKIVAAGLVHVPQGDLPFPRMTVLENLLMGAYPSDAWKNRHHQLAEVYALFPRLAEREKQLAQTLSGGERRMLALGRGLMAGAKVLMIDEPSLGLAPVLAAEVYAQIGKISSAGMTILLVDESAEHVADLADRVYVMEAGEIVLEGETASVLENEDLLAAYLG